MKNNGNAVIKKVCHSRGMLSGIYNACRCHKKEKTLLNRYVEDPRLRLSGMTPNLMGFTLIELLIVVLIIGILAAVAVPQYKVTVVKSRVATILPFGKALKDAKEAYYLKTGTYIRDVDALDINVPASCELEGNGYYSCGDFFYLDNNLYNVTLSYCPENSSQWDICHPNRDFSIIFTQDHIPADYEGKYTDIGTIYCNVHHNSSLGKTICKKFPNFVYIENH